MKSQLTMVVNEKEQLALNSQISLMQTELNQFEEKYFAFLERTERIETEKKDNKTFIEGSKISLIEIKKEVDDQTKIYQQKIDGRILRIQALIDQCNVSLINLYIDLEAKFKPLRPVAYLIDKKCSQCHMLKNATFKAAVEEGRSFETCPTCGRLLIPETAKIY